MAGKSNWSSFFQDLSEYSTKLARNNNRIARQCLIRLGDQAQSPQPSIKVTGGSFEVGKIPVDEQDLWASFTVRVNGFPAATGVDAHRVAAKQVKAGDTWSLNWSAPYARRIEFGFSGQDVLGRRFNQKGRLFATTAYNNFPQIKREVIANPWK